MILASVQNVPSVQTNTVFIPVAPLVGPAPAIVTCPTCHASMQTRIEREASSNAHLLALLCCLLGYVFKLIVSNS